jgi:hypothetical protein
MRTDFEQWLATQFAETGPFTLFIVLVRIGDEEVEAVKSSYAHMIGDGMRWRQMCRLLDGATTRWDGVGFFVGLDRDGGPLPDAAAARKLRQVEADVKADPMAFNRGRLFDRQGRHLRVDEVAR